jgi:hypothetical protein
LIGTRVDGDVDGMARGIGPVGTTVRIIVGVALLALAVADRPAGLIGGLQVHELVLGLAVFPAVMMTIGFIAGRFVTGPLISTGPVAITVNLVTIVVLFTVPYTAGAAALFYGISLLVAAWRGQPDCEATILANLILRRNDQIGCPTFTPLDAIEARLRR